MRTATLLLLTFTLWSCSEKDPVDPLPDTPSDLYFPPLSGDWATDDPQQLNWNTSAMPSLDSFMEANGTRAFLILKDGKLVHERYWGKDILNQNDFGSSTNWYWASAGKTLSAFLCGLAQQEGALSIQDPVSDHLGQGWTSMADSLEQRINVIHQLSMTTGLDHENTSDLDCTDPSCLMYLNEPGTAWFYHNAPYTLIESVISAATQTEYNTYTDQQLEGPIGMKGQWIQLGYNNVYWSTARDAARFGLLLLSEGSWDGQAILSDSSYFRSMTNTSQDLNPSYGYLTWLNGKSGIIPPGITTRINTSLAPSAPTDLYAAMGKNGQFIDVVPSRGLVVIRMGLAPDNALVPVLFHDQMWERLMQVIP